MTDEYKNQTCADLLREQVIDKSMTDLRNEMNGFIIPDEAPVSEEPWESLLERTIGNVGSMTINTEASLDSMFWEQPPDVMLSIITDLWRVVQVTDCLDMDFIIDNKWMELISYCFTTYPDNKEITEVALRAAKCLIRVNPDNVVFGLIDWVMKMLTESLHLNVKMCALSILPVIGNENVHYRSNLISNEEILIFLLSSVKDLDYEQYAIQSMKLLKYMFYWCYEDSELEIDKGYIFELVKSLSRHLSKMRVTNHAALSLIHVICLKEEYFCVSMESGLIKTLLNFMTSYEPMSGPVDLIVPLYEIINSILSYPPHPAFPVMITDDRTFFRRTAVLLERADSEGCLRIFTAVGPIMGSFASEFIPMFRVCVERSSHASFRMKKYMCSLMSNVLINAPLEIRNELGQLYGLIDVMCSMMETEDAQLLGEITEALISLLDSDHLTYYPMCAAAGIEEDVMCMVDSDVEEIRELGLNLQEILDRVRFEPEDLMVPEEEEYEDFDEEEEQQPSTLILDESDVVDDYDW